jgi:hypothetical protein
LPCLPTSIKLNTPGHRTHKLVTLDSIRIAREDRRSVRFPVNHIDDCLELGTITIILHHQLRMFTYLVSILTLVKTVMTANQSFTSW